MNAEPQDAKATDRACGRRADGGRDNGRALAIASHCRTIDPAALGGAGRGTSSRSASRPCAGGMVRYLQWSRCPSVTARPAVALI